MNKDLIKNIVLWLILVLAAIAIFNTFGPKKKPGDEYSYTQFLSQVHAGEVKTAVVDDDKINGVTKDGKEYVTYIPMKDPSLLKEMVGEKVQVSGKPPEERGFLSQFFFSWGPVILIIVFWLYIMRQQMGGGKGGAFSFGRSRARLLGDDQVKITFKDVAGCDEAKEEVSEVVDFLREPGKFQQLGGRIPRGLLLVGPPGTGKTLLAKAVAGEAKVPFFSISGSDFVEMFVGVGASRVRDMFEQAKKQAPCIIFIDEIDAVGRHRGAGMGGGHDEREQTLNQLLVEMDGFSGSEGVIVMAATNRPDVLDPALLRPGRFDRQVVVALPDVRGREQILKVHMKKVKVDNDIKPKVIARGTPGFSGADLANLINEAALFAARSNKKAVSMVELEKAKDKILMGSERTSMVMSEEEKNLTAYHEAGHAIVGLSVPDHDPVYKVTIIPRGRALGVTMFLPEQDRYSYSLSRLKSSLCSLYGGRVAEELIFGKDKVTTGASNDLQRATEIARNMVTKWGLTDKLGPMVYEEDGQEVFLGHSMTQKTRQNSEFIEKQIDEEVRTIVDENYTRATKVLQEKEDVLHAMAEALIKYETIGEVQLKQLMNRETVTPPDGWEEISKEDEKTEKAFERATDIQEASDETPAGKTKDQ
ncbi:MAG: ATP-dependent metalloprotease [Gammaproteobacteria bacterium CG11_big_fil_rev_8_21_14_0_20_46_22]|nr:MAG: ATP-dependent metalloprotease [Gammaproteobacteria bacterium CG12_big_fil_rev_8_21_14_0_65_46_12]PIR11089.1 MAG: ATP-dependent metalloprotease [Gammaproteobacteria bacterium CG11_big_fil_rev_8_21_14_0_20_46_22]